MIVVVAFAAGSDKELIEILTAEGACRRLGYREFDDGAELAFGIVPTYGGSVAESDPDSALGIEREAIGSDAIFTQIHKHTPIGQSIFGIPVEGANRIRLCIVVEGGLTIGAPLQAIANGETGEHLLG